MARKYRGEDRREYLRFEYKKPLQYTVIDASKKKDRFSSFLEGISKNLSASGMFFITGAKAIPKIFSIVAFELDYRTISICQEIENRALVVNNKLLGKVMRIENNNDGTYGIGVAFVTKADPIPEDIKELAM
jgi:hypothetical protein